jgi:uncharacterized phage protein gp47/JayE
MSYVTSAGLITPTLEELLAEVATDQRAKVDPLLDTSAESPIGQLNGIVMSKVREAFEIIQIGWDSRNPDNAEGQLLVAVSAITGTQKAPATPSRFTGAKRLVLDLDAGAEVAIGTTFAVDGDDNTRFTTTKIVKAEVAGVPTAGFYYAEAECTRTGPVACNAETLTVIVTPVIGLKSVINPTDAILGTNEDTDAELRERREKELRATGSGTVDAIGADVQDIEVDGAKPVLETTVLENDTDAVDGNGLPPHSLEVLVWDGPAADTDNDIIAQTIWDSKGGGIQLVGNTSGEAVDRLGVTRVVPFSRPDLIPIKIRVTLVKAAKGYVGDDAAKAALVAKVASAQKPGALVAASVYACVIQDLQGVKRVSGVELGRVSGAFQASYTDLLLSTREQATLDSADVTLIVTSEA